MKNVVLIVQGYPTKYEPLFKGFGIFWWEWQIFYSGNKNLAVSLAEQSEPSKMIGCICRVTSLFSSA
jgi:hypothetical protein